LTPPVRLSGHLWTVVPALRTRLAPPRVPDEERFEVGFEDPVGGALKLTGRLHAARGQAGARTLVVVVHGLAGSCDSSYVRRFVRAAAAAGFATLRLNLRGADGGTPDFYHAGLDADLATVLAAPRLAGFERIFLVGFSLGGHLVLRRAAGDPDPRVSGVAAVCAPLDLDRGATALDAPGNALYRVYLLDGLRRLADGIERRRPGFLAADRRRRGSVRTIRGWDDLVVAPRWGFDSAEDYYARASVAPRLGAVAVPTWLILAKNDPMVPRGVLEPVLGGVSATTEITWTARGGHVGFPGDLDLGRRGPRGLESQIVAWLLERA
jgi:predicted alpha/beta-fold hydrolase